MSTGCQVTFLQKVGKKLLTKKVGKKQENVGKSMTALQPVSISVYCIH